MNRPVIAVDIDDVLAASAQEFVNFTNQRWGTHLAVDDYQEDWAKMWQVDRDTETERAGEIYEARIFRRFQHYADAKSVLTELSQRYKLVIATSRVRVVEHDTMDWLQQHFGGLFEEVHFSGIYDPLTNGEAKDDNVDAMTKSELCRQIGADFLIDDQAKHCVAVAEAGIEAILFGNYGWNQLAKLPPHVTRCADWAAVQEYFDARSR